MAIIKGLETKFNEVYSEYDKWRPIYVPEVYKDIFDTIDLQLGRKP